MIPHSHLQEIARKLVIVPAVAPAAVVATGWPGLAGFEFAQGAAFKDESRASDVHAFFDLASITKSFQATCSGRGTLRTLRDF